MRVGAVELGGPAARAGLQEGDVLLSLEGAKLMGTDDLIRLLDAERIGRNTSLIEKERDRGRWLPSHQAATERSA